jgi:hypothetical protein
MSGFDDESIAALAESHSQYDPTVIDGFSPLFNKEVRITFVIPDRPPDSRIVRARIFARGDPENIQAIRLEITQEAELKFYLVCSLDAAGFEALEKAHNLRPAFSDFSKSVIDLLERSVRFPKEHQLEFRSGDGVSGSLAFIQMLRLRKVEVFVLDFQPAPDEFVKRQAQFRFNSLKVELEKVSQGYATLTNRLEEKNPHLVKQIKETVEKTVFKPPQ